MRAKAGLLLGVVTIFVAVTTIQRLEFHTGRDGLSKDSSRVRWRQVVDLPRPIAQFETVFWEPADSTSLRMLLRERGVVRGKTVLEIGTGTGLLALCCAQHGAERVVATDINPTAVKNASFNAALLGLSSRMEFRTVSMEDAAAYSVLEPGEKFDLIVSNPPWEDDAPSRIDDFALYDPGFGLLDSLLAGMDERLTDDGKALLAYGCVTAIHRVQELAPDLGLNATILDDRELAELPEVFLPGMLIEVTRASMDQR